MSLNFHKMVLCALAGFMAVIAFAAELAAQPADPKRGYLGETRSSYSVFVFGDSLAAGLWAGMNRMTKGNARIKVNGRFKESKSRLSSQTLSTCHSPTSEKTIQKSTLSWPP